jgi:hypothetical protein
MMNNGRNSLSTGVLCLAPDTIPKKSWMIWVKKRNWKRNYEWWWLSRVSVYLGFLDGRRPRYHIRIIHVLYPYYTPDEKMKTRPVTTKCRAVIAAPKYTIHCSINLQWMDSIHCIHSLWPMWLRQCKGTIPPPYRPHPTNGIEIREAVWGGAHGTSRRCPTPTSSLRDHSLCHGPAANGPTGFFNCCAPCGCVLFYLMVVISDGPCSRNRASFVPECCTIW